jgi:hypothetical protein
MDRFCAPLRIQVVYDQLVGRAELNDCRITMEELVPDNDMLLQFPAFDWDTCRVYVRYADYSVNVVGCLEDGNFRYRANAYRGPEPWGQQYIAGLGQLNSIVEFVIGKFDLVPRNK